jgi:hypothetical protein
MLFRTLLRCFSFAVNNWAAFRFTSNSDLINLTEHLLHVFTSFSLSFSLTSRSRGWYSTCVF